MDAKERPLADLTYYIGLFYTPIMGIFIPATRDICFNLSQQAIERWQKFSSSSKIETLMRFERRLGTALGKKWQKEKDSNASSYGTVFDGIESGTAARKGSRSCLICLGALFFVFDGAPLKIKIYEWQLEEKAPSLESESNQMVLRQ